MDMNCELCFLKLAVFSIIKNGILSGEKPSFLPSFMSVGEINDVPPAYIAGFLHTAQIQLN